MKFEAPFVCPTFGVQYKLLSDGFINLVDSFTYGAKMPRASSEQIGNVVLPLPPLPEQRAIAAYLDRETAKIDALIAKKERLIELLQEKRTALISHAVTRGVQTCEVSETSQVWSLPHRSKIRVWRGWAKCPRIGRSSG